ncbi:hypothetical protein ACMFMG_009183 [Clarireedia jacksonii]
MGNTSSSPNQRHRSSRGIRDRCPSKRQSRTNSELSDSTTSTSTSSSSSGPRSRKSFSSFPGGSSPSSPRKSHRHRSLNAADKIGDGGRVDVEEVKPPIRMGYPYYEELMVPEKGGKKKRRSFRS